MSQNYVVSGYWDSTYSILYPDINYFEPLIIASLTPLLSIADMTTKHDIASLTPKLSIQTYL